MYRLIILFCCFSSFIEAQVSISVDKDTVYSVGLTEDFEIQATVNFINNGPSSTFTWIRDDSGFVNGWDSNVVDSQISWFHEISSASIPIESNQTSQLTIKLNPREICGVGFGVISLTDDSDSTNTIAIRFNFEVNNVDGSVCENATSVLNFSLDYIEVFPNPVNDFFSLTGKHSDLELIQIYSITGQKVKSFIPVPDTYYDISDLNSGLYLVKLTNTKEDNLNTIKLSKN